MTRYIDAVQQKEWINKQKDREYISDNFVTVGGGSFWDRASTWVVGGLILLALLAAVTLILWFNWTYKFVKKDLTEQEEETT